MARSNRTLIIHWFYKQLFIIQLIMIIYLIFLRISFTVNTLKVAMVVMGFTSLTCCHAYFFRGVSLPTLIRNYCQHLVDKTQYFTSDVLFWKQFHFSIIQFAEKVDFVQKKFLLNLIVPWSSPGGLVLLCHFDMSLQ